MENKEQFIVRVRQEDLDKAEGMARSGKIKVIEVGEKRFYVAAGKSEEGDTITVWPVEWGWEGRWDGWVTTFGDISLLHKVVTMTNLVKELAEFKDEAVIEIIPKQN